MTQPIHRFVLLPTAILRKTFRRLNGWIDSLLEPWRRIVVATIAVGWFVPILGWHVPFGEPPMQHPILAYVGLGWLLFVGLWGLSRA